MYIHKEGYKISLLVIILSVLLIGGITFFVSSWNFFWTLLISSITISAFFIIRFFRIPNRTFVNDEDVVICPADGTIVVTEPVFENEILHKECLQISVFMSPNNVHVNRYPVSGKVTYVQYHSGKYLIAKHPKSSLLNERTTICIETPHGDKLVVRQIAGALARRIVCYAKEGQEVSQNDELGFIKFGSRVDILIPSDSILEAQIEDKVKGGITVLAHLNHAPAVSNANTL